MVACGIICNQLCASNLSNKQVLLWCCGVECGRYVSTPYTGVARGTDGELGGLIHWFGEGGGEGV